jgi:stringent starvation protein B
MVSAQETTSTRPYLIRALYEWCTDNGFTPYVAVRVDDGVQVPREFVKNGEIVLNISADATSALKLSNEFIEFKARFAGVARDIVVPMDHVLAIYARENGQGMAFAPQEAHESAAGLDDASASSVQEPSVRGTEIKPVQLSRVESERSDDEPPAPPRSPSGGARPSLKRVK